MPPGAPLVNMGHGYHFAVFVQITHKTDTGGRAYAKLAIINTDHKAILNIY
jgi:hypothetical protein